MRNVKEYLDSHECPLVPMEIETKEKDNGQLGVYGVYNLPDVDMEETRCALSFNNETVKFMVWKKGCERIGHYS